MRLVKKESTQVALVQAMKSLLFAFLTSEYGGGGNAEVKVRPLNGHTVYMNVPASSLQTTGSQIFLAER